MQRILLETRIAAPAMRVFLLSLSVDLHTESTKQTNERAIAGVTRGVMSLGDVVTWQAKHFGLRLTHTSQITEYSAPSSFVDVMTKGLFKSFIHTHTFEEIDGITTMKDILEFSSPFGLLGRTVDHIILYRYLGAFLKTRNALIKETAEGGRWQEFLRKNP